MFHINNTIELITSVYNSPNSDKVRTIPRAKDDNGKFLKHLETSNGNFDIKKYNIQPPLENVKYPFFMAMKKKEFIDIGGYDEDFTGTDFDDADFVNRLIKNGNYSVETKAQTIHLYHERLKMSKERTPRYKHNKKLYEERKGIVIRNIGKDWGVL